MSLEKIKSPDEIAAIRDSLDRAGRRLVFTNGCFDLLHAGHVRYLSAARALGDALVVALNGDDSVRALKGPARPLNAEADRAEVLASLGCVDFVTVFHEPRVTGLVGVIRPHVYTKGGDYTVASLDPGERAALESAGAEIRILPLVPGRSTTALIQRGAAGAAAASPLRLGILGSGKGSNFVAIADAIAGGKLRAEIALVASDHADSGILAHARARNLPAIHIAPGGFKTKLDPAAEVRLADALRAAHCDLIVLAGWMRMIKAPLLDAFPGRIINIHPSLLPDFPGLQAWRQALDAGAMQTGCTVHFVDAGMDTGPVIAQAVVPVLRDDTPETLHARIQAAEHWLYPAVIGRFADEKARG